MTKVYDVYHNELELGKPVLIRETGEIDTIKAIHSENLSTYAAEHNRCVELQHGQYAPIDIARIS